MTPDKTIRLNKKIFPVLFIILFVFFAYPVASDYLGPNRTYSFWMSERSTCNYQATLKANGLTCTLTLFAPPSNCPLPNATAPYFNGQQGICPGWGATTVCDGLPVNSNCNISLTGNSVGPCSMGETGCTNVEYIGSQPPATISGNVTCTGSTVNGWCTGVASLDLSANEPVANKKITLIEWTRNGESFACAPEAISCAAPLLEGQNDFTFWALSSWGDSSLMGSASGKVDTQSPSISGSLSGTGGSSGWYVSNVLISASASDPTPGSGLSSFTYTLDSGAAQSFPGSLTLLDGVHTVLLQAADGAGHVTTFTRSASVDTTPPMASFTYAPPASGWLSGSVTIPGTASDGTSGVAQVEYSTNGGGTWQSLGGATSWSFPWSASDGTYTLQVRARDAAGNQGGTASLTLSVDNTPPQATLDAPASFCPSCGETASITYAVDDDTSGMASWTLSVDGTTLASGAAASMSTIAWDGGGLALGAHTLSLTGTDRAGNTQTISDTISLLSAPPAEPTKEKQSFFWFLATKTPTPLPSETQLETSATPTATRTPVVETFDAAPPVALVEESALPDTQVPNPQGILWGAAAAGAIAAATAYSLDQRRKREHEEARQRAEKEHENQEARAHEIGFDSYADMLAAQALATFDLQWNQKIQDDMDYRHEREKQGSVSRQFNLQADKEFLNWLYTGKNPPADYVDTTEDERLALYKQTNQYLCYQARMEGWEQYKVWLRSGGNPPPGYEDITEAERLTLYQQTSEYADYRTSLAQLTWFQINNQNNVPNKPEFMTEAERLAVYRQTQQYQEYQESLQNWEYEKQKEKQYEQEQELLQQQRKKQLLSEYRNATLENLLEFKITPALLAWLRTGQNPPLDELRQTEFDIKLNEMIVCINSSAYFYHDKMSIDMGDSGGWTIPRDAQVIWTGYSYKASSDDVFFEVKWEHGGKVEIGWINSEWLVSKPDNTLSNQPSSVDDEVRTVENDVAQYINSPFEIYLKNGVSPIPSSFVLDSLCGYWSVSYLTGKSMTQVLKAALDYEISEGRVVYEGINPENNKEKYRIFENSLVYPAFTNQATSCDFLKNITETFPSTRTQSISEVLRSGNDFRFLAGLAREQLSQGQLLFMGVRTDRDCNLNSDGTSTHFVAVTDIYFENDQWMVRYYDPWTNSLKMAPFGTPDDPTSFCGAAAYFDNGYSGFFVNK